ncbi:MAG: amino acid racemase [Lysobacterales bacterium]|jgi:aspartate racemase
MTAPRPLLGILGGMGPQAGVDLAGKLISTARAGSDQDHLPFVLFSMPGQIADRTDYLLGNTDINPAHAIADQLETMSGLGVTVAVMACNTAHAAPIFDVILQQLRKNRVELQLLHLVHESVAYISREFPGIGKVGVLGTSGAHQSRLYEKALAGAGLEAVAPDPSFREEVLHAAVYDRDFGIKATAGEVSAKARGLILSALDHLNSRGAEAVILGCTELPLAINAPCVAGIPVLDPAQIVAERLVHMLRPDRSAR